MLVLLHSLNKVVTCHLLQVTGPAIEIFGNAVPPILLILLPIGVGTLIFSAIAWIITQTIYIPTDMRKVGRRSLPSDDEQL